MESFGTRLATVDKVDPDSLDAAHRLFYEFDQYNVVYCHWESNAELAEGLLGHKDLDVLVEKGNATGLSNALHSAGFKRFLAVSANNYPGVEDYLGVDRETGKMLHLHLHHQIVIGEKNLRSYHLPWEKKLLATRLIDQNTNIYIIDPHFEMLLLLVSAVLKHRIRDRIVHFKQKNYFDKTGLIEFQWLKEAVNDAILLKNAEALLPKQSLEPLRKIITTSEPSMRQILDFQRHTKSYLQLYRTYTPLHARGLRYLRELVQVFRFFNKHYIHSALPLKRVNVRGGVLVAVLGCDGAGKSTQVEKLTHWLSWKMDVLPAYFGSGDGSSSLLRWPIKCFARLFVKRTGSRAKKYQGDRKKQEGDAGGFNFNSRLRLIARVIWALSLSLEKYHKLRKVNMARNRGMVVICDRYPQNQIMGFNDGPLLSVWRNHRSGLLKTLARWESRPYCLAEDYPPDLVIKLNIAPEVAIKRKKDMCMEESLRRVDAIKNVNYHAQTKIINIDASKPFDEVLLEMKRGIWEMF